MPLVDIKDVRKNFGQVEVLRGVSMEVTQSDVVAIIGRSGSGKSTLLRCINGLEQFQEGEVAVGSDLKLMGGLQPAQDTLLQLRRSVGMVFQQFNLFPHMTALENVMSGPVYALGRPREEAQQAAHRLLDRVGLGNKTDSKPAQLSGGQQQRVAIARALAVNPAAILFDEPTSALDPRMAAEVMRVIDDLADDEQFQAAMVIVTHDLQAVQRIADTVHILVKGRVAYSGKAEEAFAPGGPIEKME